MTTEYKETHVPLGDARTDVLDALAEGPWAFIVAKNSADGDPDGIDLSVEVGGGVSSSETLRNLLVKTLNALPE